MSNHYNVLVTRTYMKDGAEKTAFTKIGVAFPMKEKDGFQISLEALPLMSIGQTGKLECKMLLMPPIEDGADKSVKKASSVKSEPLNDSIPF